jgi:hypothetical protein
MRHGRSIGILVNGDVNDVLKKGDGGKGLVVPHGVEAPISVIPPLVSLLQLNKLFTAM